MRRVSAVFAAPVAAFLCMRLDSGTVDLSSAGDVAALTISGGGTLKDANVGALTLQTVSAGPGIMFYFR